MEMFVLGIFKSGNPMDLPSPPTYKHIHVSLRINDKQ